MKKYKVLKKTIGANGMVVDIRSEVVLAYLYDVSEGCLEFFDSDKELVKMFAFGIWIEVEKTGD